MTQSDSDIYRHLERTVERGQPEFREQEEDEISVRAGRCATRRSAQSSSTNGRGSRETGLGSCLGVRPIGRRRPDR